MILNIFSFSSMSKEEVLTLVVALFFFCLPFMFAHFFNHPEDKIEKGDDKATAKDECKGCKAKDSCLRCRKKAKGGRKCQCRN